MRRASRSWALAGLLLVMLAVSGCVVNGALLEDAIQQGVQEFISQMFDSLAEALSGAIFGG